MTRIIRTTVDDERLLPYRNLRHASHAEAAGLFVAEGRWLAVRLLESETRVHSVLVEARRISDVEPHLDDDTTLFVIPDKGAEELVGFNFHRGVLACGYRPDPRRLQELPLSTPSTLLVACRIQDPENLGLMLRNCAAFGVDAIILGPRMRQSVFPPRPARLHGQRVFCADRRSDEPRAGGR